MTDHLIAPHGGTLTDLVIDDDRAPALKEASRDVRRWMAKVGEAVEDLVTIAVAEGSGAELDDAVEAVRNSAAPLTIGDLAVDGTDLMGIGVAQGPALGQLLAGLLDEVLVDPTANTKPRLLERAAGMKPAG